MVPQLVPVAKAVAAERIKMVVGTRATGKSSSRIELK
jgi:hypothetical protein